MTKAANPKDHGDTREATTSCEEPVSDEDLILSTYLDAVAVRGVDSPEAARILEGHPELSDDLSVITALGRCFERRKARRKKRP